MSDIAPSWTVKAALRSAFPWAQLLTEEDLDAFAAELHSGATTGWPLQARQNHEAVVVAYWRDRAASQ
ncbi:hypothetical protein ACFUC1_08945 [Pedococcus sp. NPDC057267]|uniref:hypothetical protein n=1 Tax=Pedococcus sp. NPDC057267 TaxID=3346077 RepID=UPI0036303597